MSDSERTIWPGAPEPLGVTVTESGVNVALWSPDASSVDFALIENGHETAFRLPERTGPVWHGFIPGIPVGSTYGFRVAGPWEPSQGLRYNPAKLLIDPYARAVCGELTPSAALLDHQPHDESSRNDSDSSPFVPHSVVVSSAFDWRGTNRPATAWSDTVIYETHVRGLTMRHPGVPEHLRGTYAGLAQPIVIDHLLKLGVTTVELLPVHQHVPELDLLERGLTNFWGYNSVNYFAPHAGYAATGHRGQQVDEFKAMVRDLHEAGLEVVLDVVYNHTAEGGRNGPTLSFRGIDNPGYYRLGSDRREYVDYTGTGNTLNVPTPHVLRLIMDSLRYWATDMRVDGFRFDLASALARSLHDVDLLGTFLTTIEQDPILRRVKLIAEPWDIGSGGYQVGEFPPLWNEWNDKYRDSVRDFWRGSGSVRELGWRLAGSSDLYQDDARRPTASINFVTAHDGFTLRDLVTYEHKQNLINGEGGRDGSETNRSKNYGVEGETDDPQVNAVRQRQLRNLLATLYLSAGVPMLVAGDEMGRTQSGNNNAYCQDNEVSWVKWELADWQQQLLRFTQLLGELRRDHPVFRQRTFFTGQANSHQQPADVAWFGLEGQQLDDAGWHDAAATTIGMYRSGAILAPNAHGESIVDDSMLLVLHSGDTEVQFHTPGLPYANEYRVLLDTSQPNADESRTLAAGTSILLQPLSAILLAAELPDQRTRK